MKNMFFLDLGEQFYNLNGDNSGLNCAINKNFAPKWSSWWDLSSKVTIDLGVTMRSKVTVGVASGDLSHLSVTHGWNEHVIGNNFYI